MVSIPDLRQMYVPGFDKNHALVILIVTILLVLLNKASHSERVMQIWNRHTAVRWFFYNVLLLSLIFFRVETDAGFIYFNF